jgi:hypothetical protein
MVDERNLRELFAESRPAGTIDADAVIRRSRRRRLPRQLAAGSIGALAVVGIGVLGVQTLAPPQQSAVMMEQQDEANDTALAPEAAKRIPADRLNLCEGPLTEAAPSAYGLQAEVVFPAVSPATGQPVAGVVLVTNTGDARVTGSIASSPAVTLSQQGIVLWHSNGAVDTPDTVVDLEPGQSLEVAASFTPVRCAVEDDAAEAFRADLPPLAPGEYDLSAALDFAPDPSMAPATPELDLVTGPRSTISLE